MSNKKNPAPRPSDPAWRALQGWLRDEWDYTGKIDGHADKGTWEALQRYLTRRWDYAGPIDGEATAETWQAVQRWLRAAHGYAGIVDGIPGPLTDVGLQHAGSVPMDVPPASEFPKLELDGDLGVESWKRLQAWLRRDWLYAGEIDGEPGPDTFAALDRAMQLTVPTDVERWAAAQEFLLAHGFEGNVDGEPGPMTHRALQRYANAVL